MERDGTDFVCKSLMNMSLNRSDTTTPYISPLIKKNNKLNSQFVPPTPHTPYVPPKSLLQQALSGKENLPATNSPNAETRARFNKLILNAREAEAIPNHKEAIRLYIEASGLCPPNPKLERKISNLKKLVVASATISKPSPAISKPNAPTPSLSKHALITRVTPTPVIKPSLPPPLSPAHEEIPTSPIKSNIETIKADTREYKRITKKKEVEPTHTFQASLWEKEKQPTKQIIQEEKRKEVEEPRHEDAGEEGEEEEEEEEEEEAEEKVMEMVEQPNGYFHDPKHQSYVLKETEEGKELSMAATLYNQLFDYQRDGVKWMWGLYMAGKGGILGDDMGLGKTMQVVAFLSTMIRSGHISHALVVMPVGVIEHWKSELEKWGEGIRVRVFHGTSMKERETSIDRVVARGGVLLTTYGMVLNQTKRLCSLTWDYVIFDEGHKIKDPLRKISQSARELKAVNKILLSGTPIQNNLKEMWALFDWACDGKLLGNFKSFRTGYETPIVAGLDRHASLEEKQIGETVSQELMRHIAPHFLRRDKKSLFGRRSPSKNNASPSSSNTSTSTPTKSPPKPANVCITRKNDLVVWLRLSEPQHRLYEDFLGSEEVRNALNQSHSHLAALTRLKQICTHPCLLSPNSQPMPLAFHQANSAKISFLTKLIPELQAGGHRLLIFSQYTTMLDVIQSCITEMGCSFVRIDGSINSTAERERRIKLFNTKKSIFCFLLTTGAGALGLNLTSADRVLIFDPSWNTVDNQAVDRAYRVGQTKDVVIYRLILCGTIEEKMYRKQVYKSALQGMMRAGSQYRYFTKQDLSEMFVLDDVSCSATQKQLALLHDDKIRTYPYLDEHLTFLHDTLGIIGVSHHDLLFSEQPEDVEKSEIGKHIAARAQDLLFTEPTSSRRRTPKPKSTTKPTRTPKSMVITLDEEDQEDDDDYEIGVGVRSNPISIDDEDEQQEDGEERRGAGDRSQNNNESEEQGEEIPREGDRKFRRLRRIITDDDEEEGQARGDDENDREEKDVEDNQPHSCAEDEQDMATNYPNISMTNDESPEQVDDDNMHSTHNTSTQHVEVKSSASCERHRAAVAPFICNSCSCNLTAEESQVYEETLEKAKIHHRNGRSWEALQLYKQCAFICDDNIHPPFIIVLIYFDPN